MHRISKNFSLPSVGVCDVVANEIIGEVQQLPNNRNHPVAAFNVRSSSLQCVWFARDVRALA